ncbi:beta-1,3-galactosyltransferase brn-like [Styela clava]
MEMNYFYSLNGCLIGTILEIGDMKLLPRLIAFSTVYLSAYMFILFWRSRFLHGSVDEFLHLKMMNKLTKRRQLFSFLMRPMKIKVETPRSNLLNLTDPGLRWSMIVFVKSHTSHRSRRMLARMSWASFEYVDGIRIETIFIVGKAENQIEQSQLEDENKKYGDLLQINIEEKYSNVGLKTLAGMQYAASHFPPDWMYVTADDDIMPDLKHFLNELDEMRKSNKNIGKAGGECDSKIVCGLGCVVSATPKRLKDSKWYINEEDYPIIIYPAYCMGGLYGMSVKLVKDLYRISRTLPFFWIDDVWITGFLRLRHFITVKSECRTPGAEMGLWSTSADVLSVTGTEDILIQEWTKYVAKIHEKQFIHVNDHNGHDSESPLPFEFKAWLEYVFHETPQKI